jgi:hypothetical protein
MLCRVSDTGPLVIYQPVRRAGVRKPSGKEPARARRWLSLAGALGLRGDIDEAKTALAEAQKREPEKYSSMAKLLASTSIIGTPKFLAMHKKTFDAGLLRSGIPED